MALQTSGAISLADLATEFGDTTPYSMSEFYRGGSLVPNSAANTSVPTSGAISLGNFYGAQNSLWATTLTAGYFTTNFPSYVYTSGYSSYLFAGFGSLSDTTVDFYSGAFCLSIYTNYVGGSNYYLYFEVGGSQSNSGWTSMTIPGFGTYNRASGTFYTNDEEGGVGWYWSSGTNVFSPGSTYAITFQ